MGLAGKPPRNNAYKAITGVHISKMTNETPAPGTPVRPSQLAGYAAEFWDRYIPELISLGMAGNIDTPALTQLANYYGIWQSTADELQAADLSSIQGSRLLNCHIRAGDSFRRLAVMYGMTCLARQSVNMKAPDDKDEFLK